MIHGADDHPLDICFEQIDSVKSDNAYLYITLKNDNVIRASLISDDCRIKFPNDNDSLGDCK